MFEWLKTAGSGLVVAALGFLAFMAAQRAAQEKATARRWKDAAVANTTLEVEGQIMSAKAALTEAKLHDARAKDAEKLTKKRLDQIGGRSATMADITSSWRKPKSQ